MQAPHYAKIMFSYQEQGSNAKQSRLGSEAEDGSALKVKRQFDSNSSIKTLYQPHVAESTELDPATVTATLKAHRAKVVADKHAEATPEPASIREASTKAHSQS